MSTTARPSLVVAASDRRVGSVRVARGWGGRGGWWIASVTAAAEMAAAQAFEVGLRVPSSRNREVT